MASSELDELPGGWPHNYITYRITGDRYAAKELSLVFYAHNGKDVEQDVQTFRRITSILLKKSLDATLDDLDFKKLEKTTELAEITCGKEVTLKKHCWPNAPANGFDLRLTISCPKSRGEKTISGKNKK